MRNIFIRALFLNWIILGGLMSEVAHAETEILSLNSAALREMTLESLPPWPDEMVLSGTNEHWQTMLHKGEFVIALYEAMPATIDVAIPYTYDEYVLVLEGSVVLVSTEGVRQEYQTGDQFLVPQGWTGTWEMSNRFRELIIVETEQWEASESLLAALFASPQKSGVVAPTVLPLLARCTAAGRVGQPAALACGRRDDRHQCPRAKSIARRAVGLGFVRCRSRAFGGRSTVSLRRICLRCRGRSDPYFKGWQPKNLRRGGQFPGAKRLDGYLGYAREVSRENYCRDQGLEYC